MLLTPLTGVLSHLHRVDPEVIRAVSTQRVYGKYFEKSQEVTSHSVPLYDWRHRFFQRSAVAFDFANGSQYLVVKRNTFRTPSQISSVALGADQHLVATA